MTLLDIDFEQYSHFVCLKLSTKIAKKMLTADQIVMVVGKRHTVASDVHHIRSRLVTIKAVFYGVSRGTKD
jgi:hypothetical protein